MLHEAADELGCVDPAALHLAGAILAVTEDDVLAVEALDAAIGDGDAVNVATEVLQHLLAGAGMLAVDDPSPSPGSGADARDQLLLVQSISDLRTEDDRERPSGKQEGRIPRRNPACVPVVESACGDEDVDVGMVTSRCT